MTPGYACVPACGPSEWARIRVGDKRTVMVVGGLSKADALQCAAPADRGVSHRRLTLALRRLEHDGLVKRTVYPSVPAKVESELTDIGKSLIKPLSGLSEWVQRNQPAIEAA